MKVIFDTQRDQLDKLIITLENITQLRLRSEIEDLHKIANQLDKDLQVGHEQSF